MFEVEQRDALRERVLRLAHDDPRVVAGAAVGSLALGGGDRYSDLDLTFAVAEPARVSEVLDDWTRTLSDAVAAVQLLDLVQGSTTYRVFLLPDLLQFDLSMTPASQFRQGGPKFRLLFGEVAPGEPRASVAPDAANVFGWGVVYALHARSCIGRGRLWQAEHYVGAVRDHAIVLACLREGTLAVQARGYDDLSAATLARFAACHVGEVAPDTLRAALGASARALIHEGSVAGLAHVDVVAERIRELY